MKEKTKTALIVTSATKLDLQVYNNEDYFIIGVERGCLELIKQGIRIDLAISDFDHVNEEELQLIASNAIVFDQLNPKKAILDGQAALNYVRTEGFYPIKFLVQATQRFDMNISVMGLIKEYDQLEIFNENTLMKKIPAGVNEIEYLESKYVSFYSLADGNEITLKNFVYETDKMEANNYSLAFLSNEFLPNQNATIENKFDIVMIVSQ